MGDEADAMEDWEMCAQAEDDFAIRSTKLAIPLPRRRDSNAQLAFPNAGLVRNERGE